LPFAKNKTLIRLIFAFPSRFYLPESHTLCLSSGTLIQLDLSRFPSWICHAYLKRLVHGSYRYFRRYRR